MAKLLAIWAVCVLAACAANDAPAITRSTLPTGDRAYVDAGAGNFDLLYVSESIGVVNVYKYWEGSLVGVLTNFKDPKGECVDGAGDVYIADDQAGRVFEYAHGAEKPLRTLLEPRPYACAVSLNSGSLAVASRYEGVWVFPRGGTKQVFYSNESLSDYTALAYDNRGNLLVTDGAKFAYLSQGRGHLNVVKIADAPSSTVTGIQWDGKHWVLDTGYLYRVSITGNRGKVVGVTQLSSGGPGPAWIYNNDPLKQGTQAVEAVGSTIEFWYYPRGGSPIGEISRALDDPYAVTVSLKTGL